MGSRFNGWHQFKSSGLWFLCNIVSIRFSTKWGNIMKESPSLPALSESQRKTLVIEHAKLAAEIADSPNKEYEERMREIERRLSLTGQEVA